MSQKLRNIAQRYAAGQGQQSGWAKQPRDSLGRWVSQHKDKLATVATKSIAAGTGLAGGAIAGPVGAALGQLAGDLAARTAIALGEAAMRLSMTFKPILQWMIMWNGIILSEGIHSIGYPTPQPIRPYRSEFFRYYDTVYEFWAFKSLLNFLMNPFFRNYSTLNAS